MKESITVFLSLLITLNVVHSQVSEQWVARYNGPANSQDYATGLAIDSSGNVYVTGYSFGSGTDYDYCTIKYNTNGVQQWVAVYNAPANNVDKAGAVAVDQSGNVYVTGGCTSSASDYDMVTIKYNSSGAQQWVALYNGPGNGADYGVTMGLDNSGNIYVAGISMGSGTNLDYCTIKYNPSGVQQWVQRYNGTSNSKDTVYNMAVDGAGNSYVTGYATNSPGGNDYCTIKYNSAGVQQWVAVYNGVSNSFDWSYSVSCDNSGNVYVTGASAVTGNGTDYVTIKYNSAGVQQWASSYNGPYANGTDLGFSVRADWNGNVYMTGLSWGGAWQDYATVKYNSSGVQQWVARYVGPNWDWAYQLRLDKNANVYVTGFSTVSGQDRNYCTIKYNTNGVQQWLMMYDGPVNFTDEAKAMEVDSAGNVYVTGFSYGTSVTYDYVTIKYSPSVGIKKISNSVPGDYSLLQNAPNPFNPITKITFSVPKTEKVELIVYDMLGREVTVLVDEIVNAGTYDVQFNSSNLASGVYFYMIKAGDFRDIKKMTLVK
jgi:uncharacterized delta-60 repeat protein